MTTEAIPRPELDDVPDYFYLLHRVTFTVFGKTLTDYFFLPDEGNIEDFLRSEYETCVIHSINYYMPVDESQVIPDRTYLKRIFYDIAEKKTVRDLSGNISSILTVQQKQFYGFHHKDTELKEIFYTTYPTARFNKIQNYALRNSVTFTEPFSIEYKNLQMKYMSADTRTKLIVDSFKSLLKLNSLYGGAGGFVSIPKSVIEKIEELLSLNDDQSRFLASTKSLIEDLQEVENKASVAKTSTIYFHPLVKDQLNKIQLKAF